MTKKATQFIAVVLSLIAAVAASANGNNKPTKDNTAPSLRFSKAHIATGVRLHFAEQGDPKGHPIILLHGYTDSWFSFSRVLPLIPATYHVYALDQRGHGDSDRPESGYSMADLASDVIAFMDAKGLQRAAILGHSMGSFVAQQVALAAPQRVTQLVLVGSATTPHKVVGIYELQQAVESLSDPVPTDFAREFQVSTIYQPVPTDFMNQAVEASLKLPARVWRALMTGMLATDQPVRLNDQRIQTLILWGDRDAYFPRTEQEALAATMPNAVLKVYPETGHSPQWERPEKFVHDLNDFFAQTEER